MFINLFINKFKIYKIKNTEGYLAVAYAEMMKQIWFGK
jgi:hypothetical protein